MPMLDLGPAAGLLEQAARLLYNVPCDVAVHVMQNVAIVVVPQQAGIPDIVGLDLLLPGWTLYSLAQEGRTTVFASHPTTGQTSFRVILHHSQAVDYNEEAPAQTTEEVGPHGPFVRPSSPVADFLNRRPPRALGLYRPTARHRNLLVQVMEAVPRAYEPESVEVEGSHQEDGDGRVTYSLTFSPRHEDVEHLNLLILREALPGWEFEPAFAEERVVCFTLLHPDIECSILLYLSTMHEREPWALDLRPQPESETPASPAPVPSAWERL